jgi:hypothetical protein
MKISRFIVLGLLLSGVLLSARGMTGKVGAALAPAPPTVSIIAVHFDAPAPEKCLALVLDTAGDLLDAKGRPWTTMRSAASCNPPRAASPSATSS